MISFCMLLHQTIGSNTPLRAETTLFAEESATPVVLALIMYRVAQSALPINARLLTINLSIL